MKVFGTITHNGHRHTITDFERREMLRLVLDTERHLATLHVGDNLRILTLAGAYHAAQKLLHAAAAAPDVLDTAQALQTPKHNLVREYLEAELLL